MTWVIPVDSRQQHCQVVWHAVWLKQHFVVKVVCVNTHQPRTMSSNLSRYSILILMHVISSSSRALTSSAGNVRAFLYHRVRYTGEAIPWDLIALAFLLVLWCVKRIISEFGFNPLSVFTVNSLSFRLFVRPQSTSRTLINKCHTNLARQQYNSQHRQQNEIGRCLLCK